MGRVLQLISHLEEGGAQRQLSYLLSHARNHEPEVAALVASPPERRFPPLRETPAHALSDSSDFYAPEILRNLRKLLRENRYSLIHCWMFESIIQGVIAARLEGIPCLAAPHALLEGLRMVSRKRWEIRMVRGTLAMADLVLFASHTMAIDFAGAGWVDPCRARVVQNGVDCDFFHPAGSGDRLVTVGRYSPEKGFSELAEVMRILRKDFPGITCLAAGGGEHPEVEGMEFTGFVNDVRPVIGRGSIYITTSRTEGLSCSLLEAQAMGLPAVARKIGSNSEVIEHGVNGFLAESAEEFAERCKSLLDDHSLRAEMGRKARERMIANFPIQQQVQKIESIYGELL